MADDIKLRLLIKWPEREVLWISTTACYRASFGKTVVVIIDCFEVFIKRPFNLLVRGLHTSTIILSRYCLELHHMV